MRKMIACAVAALLVGSVLYSGADARPQYKSEFEKKYPKVKAANKITCDACHVTGEKDKKKRNDYGTALAKAIGKNEKDKGKIDEALGKTEKEKSGTKDKTFGDLLEDGKLPGK